MSHEQSQAPFEKRKPRFDASGLPMLTPEQKSERDKSAKEAHSNFVQILHYSPHKEVTLISSIDSDYISHGTKDTDDLHDTITECERTCYVIGVDQELYKITAVESARSYPRIRIDFALPSKQTEYLRFTSQGNEVVAKRTTKPNKTTSLQTNELDGILINFLEHNFVSREEAERIISESQKHTEPHQAKSRRKALLSKLAIRKS